MARLTSRLHLGLPLALAAACWSCGGPPAARPTPVVVPTPGTAAPTGGTPAVVVVDDAAPLALWSQVRRGTLPNGLTYYVMPHPEPAQRASLWLAVNAGSLQEDDDQQGLAHFVEHMAFNGTAHFPKQAIIDYLEKIGMEFGPDVNAYTSWDQTVYQLQVPTDDGTHVTTGLDILREWAGGLSFEPVEVEKERGVVLEEWRLRRGAFSRVFEKQAQVLYGGTRYATRLPIGQPEIIKTAPRAAAQRFYRDWYRPELMAVIVVGDIDPDAIVTAIGARFADLANPTPARPRQGGGALARSGPKVSIELDAELPRASVSIQSLFPHRAEASATDYRHYIVDSLYHQILRERLQELGRRPDAPFDVAYSSTGDTTREFESFTRGAAAKEGQIEATLEVLLTEVARVERHGFTAGELARVKKTSLKNTAQSAAEWDKAEAAEFADELTRHFFEGELVIGRVGEDALARRFAPDVTLDEVNHAARAWGGADTSAILISAAPTAKDVPTAARVLELVAAVAARPVEPWVEEAVPTTLFAQAPTAGTITAERTIADLGVTEWTLSNGAKVIVKPTDFDNQTVYMRGESPGGTALATGAVWPSARLAVEAVTAGGVGALSVGQLTRFLADRSVSVYPWLSENSEGLGGRAASADLETMLQLMHLRLTAPRQDAVAFAAWQRSRASLLEHRDLSPEAGLGDEMTRALTAGHPRRAPLTAADVRQVDLAAALAFYRDRFGDASDFTFTFTGNVDLAALRPLVATYLASLPGRRGVEAWQDIGVKPPKKVVKKVVKRGVEPKAAVQIVFHDDQAWSRDGERDLALLSSVLEIRLREILREDMGGVYGVGVGGWWTRVPRQRRALSIRFGCAPENVKALEAAVFAELKRMQRAGVAASYLDKVKEARRRAHELDLRNNGYWLEVLSDAAQLGDDPHDALALEPVLDGVTAQRLQAAAARFGSTRRYVVGVMLPAKAAPPVKAAPPAP